jgi:DNA-binding transcriptional MocR family regulator
VIVEEPTYLGALQAFRSGGVRLVGVPVDADGMRTELLEPLLARHRPRLIYTLPTFQNPSGAVMSLPRRRQLLDLAYRHQVPILEEDPYGDLRYDGRPLPSLKAMDTRGQVLHLNTFSKVLFPGLRIGWLVGPAAAVRRVAVAKQTVDLHSGTLSQWLMARFLTEGCLERHLEKVRPEYARRRDALLSALRAASRAGLVWSRPEGGFYLWCRLPEAVPPERLLAEAARERVSFLPGTVFSIEGGDATHIRLNFTASPPDRIREGVRRLARVLRTALSGPRARPEHGEVLRPLV